MSQFLGEHCRRGEPGDKMIFMPAARPGAEPGFVDAGEHRTAMLLANNTSLRVSGLDEQDVSRLQGVDTGSAVWRGGLLHFGPGKGSCPVRLGDLVPGFEAVVRAVPVR